MTSHSNPVSRILWNVPDPYREGTLTLDPPEARKLCQMAAKELKTPAYGSLTHSEIAELLDWHPDITRVSKLINGKLGADLKLTVYILERLAVRIQSVGGRALF